MSALDDALQAIINRLEAEIIAEETRAQLQQDLIDRREQEATDRAREDERLRVEDAFNERKQAIEAAKIQSQQTIGSAGLTRDQSLGTAGLNRSQTIGSADLRSQQIIESAGVQRDQNLGRAGLTRDQRIEDLIDQFDQMIQSIDENEAIGLRGVENEFLDRGLYRSGLREFDESELSRLAEQARTNEGTNLSREQRQAIEQYELTAGQASQLFDLTRQQAIDNFNLTKEQADEIFGLKSDQAQGTFELTEQQALQQEAFRKQTALEDYQTMIARLQFEMNDAIERAQLTGDQQEQDLADRLAQQISQLQITAARTQSELQRAQYETDLLGAQTEQVGTPGSGGSSAGTSTGGGGTVGGSVTGSNTGVADYGYNVGDVGYDSSLQSYTDRLGLDYNAPVYGDQTGLDPNFVYEPVANLPTYNPALDMQTQAYQDLIAQRRLAAGISTGADGIPYTTEPVTSYQVPAAPQNLGLDESFDYSVIEPVKIPTNIIKPTYDPNASVQTDDYQALIDERRRAAGVI